jgi:hypothetical protein
MLGQDKSGRFDHQNIRDHNLLRIFFHRNCINPLHPFSGRINDNSLSPSSLSPPSFSSFFSQPAGQLSERPPFLSLIRQKSDRIRPLGSIPAKKIREKGQIKRNFKSSFDKTQP